MVHIYSMDVWLTPLTSQVLAEHKPASPHILTYFKYILRIWSHTILTVSTPEYEEVVWYYSINSLPHVVPKDISPM